MAHDKPGVSVLQLTNRCLAGNTVRSVEYRIVRNRLCSRDHFLQAGDPRFEDGACPLPTPGLHQNSQPLANLHLQNRKVEDRDHFRAAVRLRATPLRFRHRSHNSGAVLAELALTDLVMSRLSLLEFHLPYLHRRPQRLGSIPLTVPSLQCNRHTQTIESLHSWGSCGHDSFADSRKRRHLFSDRVAIALRVCRHREIAGETRNSRNI